MRRSKRLIGSPKQNYYEVQTPRNKVFSQRPAKPHEKSDEKKKEKKQREKKAKTQAAGVSERRAAKAASARNLSPVPPPPPPPPPALDAMEEDFVGPALLDGEDDVEDAAQPHEAPKSAEPVFPEDEIIANMQEPLSEEAKEQETELAKQLKEAAVLLEKEHKAHPEVSALEEAAVLQILPNTQHITDPEAWTFQRVWENLKKVVYKFLSPRVLLKEMAWMLMYLMLSVLASTAAASAVGASPGLAIATVIKYVVPYLASRVIGNLAAAADKVTSAALTFWFPSIDNNLRVFIGMAVRVWVLFTPDIPRWAGIVSSVLTEHILTAAQAAASTSTIVGISDITARYLLQFCELFRKLDPYAPFTWGTLQRTYYYLINLRGAVAQTKEAVVKYTLPGLRGIAHFASMGLNRLFRRGGGGGGAGAGASAGGRQLRRLARRHARTQRKYGKHRAALQEAALEVLYKQQRVAWAAQARKFA